MQEALLAKYAEKLNASASSVHHKLCLLQQVFECVAEELPDYADDW